MNNLEKYIINPTNEFHVLRHFRFVDSSYKKSLIDKPYWYYDYAQKKFIYSKISQIDIGNALKTIGTKFDKNITGIENPKKLLKIIKCEFQKLLSANKIYWIDNLENRNTTFTLDYKSSIGQLNCVSIDNISETNKKSIKRISRSDCVGENDIVVNTISGIELSSTKTIHVEIVKTRQLPFYTITAFPDCSILDDLSDNELVFVV